MSKHLFIGGPADGGIIDTNPACDTVSVPIIPEVACVFDSDPILHFDEARYERLEFRGNKSSFFIYVLCGTSGDEALNLLIKGYVGKKDE